MRPLAQEFTFAGFPFPRYVANMAQGHRALKKKRDLRKVCGGYYHAPTPNANGGRGFYLNDAGQPFTRWVWCDEVPGVHIGHTGWFTDQYGDSEKMRGIVVRLPHGRFLAGWSMGDGMASTVASEVYTSPKDAAYAADSLAETDAERERAHQEAQEAEGATA